MFTKYAIVDDALGIDLPDRLTEFAIANRDGFDVTKTSSSDGSDAVDPAFRTSMRFGGKLGELGREFRTAITDLLPRLFEETGLSPVDSPLLENELIANGDGGSLARHIDTMTLDDRTQVETERVLSMVYYFHRIPRQFSGGELEIHPLDGGGDPELIAPRHGRLVAFPSFAPHSVRALSVPSGHFEDGRFSLNCWVRYRVA
jgi:hypothetical protein